MIAWFLSFEYNRYLEASTNKEAAEIANEIKVCNGEDLMAAYEVYKQVGKYYF